MSSFNARLLPLSQLTITFPYSADRVSPFLSNETSFKLYCYLSSFVSQCWCYVTPARALCCTVRGNWIVQISQSTHMIGSRQARCQTRGPRLFVFCQARCLQPAYSNPVPTGCRSLQSMPPVIKPTVGLHHAPPLVALKCEQGLVPRRQSVPRSWSWLYMILHILISQA
jgi:hypothetical protein